MRPDGVEHVVVFRSGEEGYHTFRIPALLATKKGTLLAFCEGRKNSRSDTGDIDLVLKRSGDHGRTWSRLQVVADHGPDTIGNPCPVQDRKTGTIWLPLTGNPGHITQKEILAGTGTRTMWMSRSDDDGATWRAPVEITSAVKDPSWTWCAAGPGNSIQLKRGRLLVPCDYSRLEHGDRALLRVLQRRSREDVAAGRRTARGNGGIAGGGAGRRVGADQYAVVVREQAVGGAQPGWRVDVERVGGR